MLELLITHQTNGIHFNALDRQRLKRARYEGNDDTLPEEVTAAQTPVHQEPNLQRQRGATSQAGRVLLLVPDGQQLRPTPGWSWPLMVVGG